MATNSISSALLLLCLINSSLLIVEALCDNILYSGEDLIAGDYLELGIYKFIMKEDCNLTLYHGVKPVWATNTGGECNCRLSMQSDGNLVIYRPDGKPLWASNTNNGNGNYILILQKDGNVVIYGCALWATNTNVYSLHSNRRAGGGAMSVVSITNSSTSVIYSDGIIAKNVTDTITGDATGTGEA